MTYLLHMLARDAWAVSHARDLLREMSSTNPCVGWEEQREAVALLERWLERMDARLGEEMEKP